LIDEYQDTNAAQYFMTKLLVGERNNIFVVGDPDQSIYSWRGANIGNILNFERDYPGAKIIRLEQNYRSRCNILQAANELISYNEGRYEKSLWSERGEGEPIKQFLAYDEREEAQFVTRVIHKHYSEGTPYREMVLFYRTNAQSRPLEDQLLHNGIPYIIYGGISFYQRKEIKDILAFLRMVYSGADFVSFARTINLPKRGIGDTSLEKIRQEAFLAGMPIFDWCCELIKGTVQPQVLRPTKKLLTGLSEYIDIIQRLRKVCYEESLSHLVMTTIQSSGYFEVLKQDPDSYEDRKENLDELISKAIEWEQNSENASLGDFLEELSLKSSMDVEGSDRDRVCLMTLHNGKGLEFSVTCIVGMEEDLLPHANSRNDSRALEEERRLCYVGMTRAKDQLYFTHAETRYIWGSPRFQRPSRFIREVPAQYRQKIRDV
ncbi:MAG: UvrD-helicase domain-containing protein, partial [Chlamydiia bacterium]|nr:UvrD-helicase domain-containing protein [Chlamydiia bacterium]